MCLLHLRHNGVKRKKVYTDKSPIWCSVLLQRNGSQLDLFRIEVPSEKSGACRLHDMRKSFGTVTCHGELELEFMSNSR